MSQLKHTIAKTVFVSSLAFTAATNSYAAEICYTPTPYLGADVETRHINWASNLGDNLFKKDYAQCKIYGSLRFFDFVGIEVGYESALPRTATHALPANARIIGEPEVLSTLTQGKFEISGPYASLLGFIPITCKDKLFLSVGAAKLKASHWVYILGDELAVANPLINNWRFSNKKRVLRIGGGLEHLFCNDFGLKLNLAWENTSKFKDLRPTNVPGSPRGISLKNSWNYGIGAFYRF